MRIAVLALQGAFAEHRKMLQTLGVESFEVRQAVDWEQSKDGLILPGGERCGRIFAMVCQCLALVQDSYSWLSMWKMMCVSDWARCISL